MIPKCSSECISLLKFFENVYIISYLIGIRTNKVMVHAQIVTYFMSNNLASGSIRDEVFIN